MVTQAHLGINLGVSLYSRLGRAIVRGEFDDRPFPNEGEICVQYNSSRTVAREAVKLLTAKGLVRSKPKTGIQIEPTSQWRLLDPDVTQWLMDRPFDIRIYREFTQMRMAIEPVAASLAAQSDDPVRVRAIETELKAMKAAGRDRRAAFNADIAFHEAVLEASGNAFFLQLKTLIRVAVQRTSEIGDQSSTIDCAMHEAVFVAIRQGDSSRAELAMRWLLMRSTDMIERLDREDPEPIPEPATAARYAVGH